MSSVLHAKSPKVEGPRAAQNADEITAADAQFLTAFGKRVRELREQRGLTRKLLARAANVSERYLGQLEAGDGNVSIVLLRRIARALGITLSDIFIPEREAGAEALLLRRLLKRIPARQLESVLFRVLRELSQDSDERRDRIALIGLRGAGKTSLGRRLAEDLAMPFIELDHEIERETGLPLSEIFTLYGQAGYRRIERRCLTRIVAAYERAVIAVGGGLVSEEDTFNLLLAQCYTVWLQAQPEEHMARVIAQGDFRPMAGNSEAMEDLKRLLAERTPLYRQADASVDTSGQTLEESFAALRQLVRERMTRKEKTHGTCG
ncbi:MAG TPA: helix-turn-helix transcriptional regulator [Methylomirabilota bacterium]|jgi:XRE family aerobic/anaerobic benzoate catabolism transcriptional regulator|nr:helix-turn-helix transcriptional regulator [Methylomirabilota bacterium]